ncbi:MAG: hypothetical protein Q8N18_13585 [Opitutaceae bacterium]|nr:hypothetical protein [Opitutaceae bacterium]
MTAPTPAAKVAEVGVAPCTSLSLQLARLTILRVVTHFPASIGQMVVDYGPKSWIFGMIRLQLQELLAAEKAQGAFKEFEPPLMIFALLSELVVPFFVLEGIDSPLVASAGFDFPPIVHG